MTCCWPGMRCAIVMRRTRWMRTMERTHGMTLTTAWKSLKDDYFSSLLVKHAYSSWYYHATQNGVEICVKSVEFELWRSHEILSRLFVCDRFKSLMNQTWCQRCSFTKMCHHSEWILSAMYILTGELWNIYLHELHVDLNPPSLTLKIGYFITLKTAGLKNIFLN